MSDRAKRLLTRLVAATGLMTPLRRAIRLVRPAWRKEQRIARYAFDEFLMGRNPLVDYGLDRYPMSRRALVVGYATPALATFQTPLLLALRMAGYRVAVTLGSASSASAAFYRAMGVSEIVETELIPARASVASSVRMLETVVTSDDLLALAEGGIPVGKFAASTLMRRNRIGRVEPRDPKVRHALIDVLTASRQAAARARTLVSSYRPDLVCFYDRGYTPDGELFEAALAAGAQATTWNAAHKSGSIVAKRYGLHNKDVHFGMPSPAFWETLQAMTWTPAHWDELRGELQECYSSGLWYDEVGTQTNKRMFDHNELKRELGLDPAKPTAVIFPHLFWDATFFWGEDLFGDYREWFVEAVRAAVANSALNWIIKIHPANLVKNRRDNYKGEFSEVLAIREEIGDLPPHITVMLPDSPVSTFSLFELMDYCLTVRGTVGLEAAMFGKSVLTAGTGRYDRFGFTIDSTTRDQYRRRLAELHLVPKPTSEQTELARRYAYGLFMLRPLETVSIRFQFAKDAGATLEATLNLAVGCDLGDMPDLARLAKWLADTKAEDLVGGSVRPAESAIAAEGIA